MHRHQKKKNKPPKWLFSGANPRKHITTRTVQTIFEQACEKGKVTKEVSVHSLRHSFATHLSESGVDLMYIQELLGHKSSKSKEIYTCPPIPKIGDGIMILKRSDGIELFYETYGKKENTPTVLVKLNLLRLYLLVMDLVTLLSTWLKRRLMP